MASLLNKAREKIEGALGQNKANNPESDHHGSHGTSTADKIDPRVDSNRGHRNDPTDRVGGFGSTQTTEQFGTTQHAEGLTTSGTSGLGGNPGYDNVRSGDAAPRSSNLLDKVDPRVHSDRDHRSDPTSRVGGVGSSHQNLDNFGQPLVHDVVTNEADNSHHGHHGHTGHAGHTGGLAAATSTGTSGMRGEDTYDNSRYTDESSRGSNILNKLDPRHKSDRDHRNNPTSRVGGYGDESDDYERTGGVQGDRRTNMPGQFDNDYSTGGYGGETNPSGTGRTSKTTGPHSSDMVNKLDPRVDSDHDGSKTYGGNQTYR